MVKSIALLLVKDLRVASISEALSIAVQLRLNIILLDALLPARTEVPGVLERIVMELGAAIDGDSIKEKLSGIEIAIQSI